MENLSSNYPKADTLKRFIAIFIDWIIVFVIAFIPVLGGITGMLYFLFRDGFEWEFMSHRSLGKRIMKLKVVVVEGNNGVPDLKTSLKRNWLFAIPSMIAIIPVLGWILLPFLSLIVFLIEGVKVVNEPTGRRFGDEFAKTQVVDEGVGVRTNEPT